MGVRAVGSAVLAPVKKGFKAIQKVGYRGWQSAKRGAKAGFKAGKKHVKGRKAYYSGGIGVTGGGAAGFAAGRRRRRKK